MRNEYGHYEYPYDGDRIDDANMKTVVFETRLLSLADIGLPKTDPKPKKKKPKEKGKHRD